MRLGVGIPVREAAKRLQVTPSRIRAMIQARLLDAEKVGDRWLVDPLSVDRRRLHKAPAGRAMKSANAWAVLAVVSEENERQITAMERLSPWSRSRVRSRLRTVDLRSLAARLRGRADTRRFRTHPSDLTRIAQEPGVVRAGVSAAPEYDLDIAAPGTLEAYVSARRLAKLQRTYLFEPSASPNLILHVVDGFWPFPGSTRVVPAAVAALDLLEADDERSRRAGEHLLDRLEHR